MCPDGQERPSLIVVPPNAAAAAAAELASPPLETAGLPHRAALALTRSQQQQQRWRWRRRQQQQQFQQRSRPARREGGGVGCSLPLWMHPGRISSHQAAQVSGGRAPSCAPDSGTGGGGAVLCSANAPSWRRWRCALLKHCAGGSSHQLPGGGVSISLGRTAGAAGRPFSGHCLAAATADSHRRRRCCCYCPRRRGGRPIRDWEDLLQPELAGQIAFHDAPR